MENRDRCDKCYKKYHYTSFNTYLCKKCTNIVEIDKKEYFEFNNKKIRTNLAHLSKFFNESEEKIFYKIIRNLINKREKFAEKIAQNPLGTLSEANSYMRYSLTLVLLDKIIKRQIEFVKLDNNVISQINEEDLPFTEKIDSLTEELYQLFKNRYLLLFNSEDWTSIKAKGEYLLVTHHEPHRILYERFINEIEKKKESSPHSLVFPLEEKGYNAIDHILLTHSDEYSNLIHHSALIGKLFY
ncbi:MAG: hypothetical protein HeimC3_12180 [Candidatus Heimdallarchaeota archaeon LC_3]|nr:MAG: hypothetical protein HeimC3_12180 [Candidatus Heimdallarchaeota archaeon LC_3]